MYLMNTTLAERVLAAVLPLLSDKGCFRLSNIIEIDTQSNIITFSRKDKQNDDYMTWGSITIEDMPSEHKVRLHIDFSSKEEE